MKRSDFLRTCVRGLGLLPAVFLLPKASEVGKPESDRLEVKSHTSQTNYNFYEQRDKWRVTMTAELMKAKNGGWLVSSHLHNEWPYGGMYGSCGTPMSRKEAVDIFDNLRKRMDKTYWGIDGR